MRHYAPQAKGKIGDMDLKCLKLFLDQMEDLESNMDTKTPPMLRFLGAILPGVVIIVAGGLILAGVSKDRTPKPDYPEFTPTELLVIPS
jgi:hypothetical protein